MRPPQPLSEPEIARCRYVLGLDGERVGMLLGGLLILALVGAAQWALMVWVHAAAAGVGSAVLALGLSFLYLGLKRASPNGGNHSYRGELPFSVLALLVLLAILGVLGFGMYQLAQWTLTGVLNTQRLSLWLAVVVGVPLVWRVLLWLYAYVRLYRHAQHFFHTTVNIRHDNEVPVLLRGLSFLDQAREQSLAISLPGASTFTPPEQMAQASVADRQDLQTPALPEAKVCIPKRTTAIRLAWFSVVEDRLYEDVFPLPLDLLMDRRYTAYTGGIVWPGHSVWMLRGLRIHLQKGGTVIVHQGGKHVRSYARAKLQAVEPAEHQTLVDAARANLKTATPPDNFNAWVQRLRQSPGADQRLAMRARPFRWSLQIHGFGEIRHSVDTSDVVFSSYDLRQAELAQPEPKHLPTDWVIYKPLDDRKQQYVRLYIALDAQALYQTLLRLLGDDLEQPVRMDLDVNGWRQDQLALQLTVGPQTEAFAHWALRKTGTY
jgi:hypothetical protein